MNWDVQLLTEQWISNFDIISLNFITRNGMEIITRKRNGYIDYSKYISLKIPMIKMYFFVELTVVTVLFYMP